MVPSIRWGGSMEKVHGKLFPCSCWLGVGLGAIW